MDAERGGSLTRWSPPIWLWISAECIGVDGDEGTVPVPWWLITSVHWLLVTVTVAHVTSQLFQNERLQRVSEAARVSRFKKKTAPVTKKTKNSTQLLNEARSGVKSTISLEINALIPLYKHWSFLFRPFKPSYMESFSPKLSFPIVSAN